MIAVLTKIFGLKNIETAEDIVQDVLIKALEQWKFSGIPDNPSGWLMTVAKNKTLDLLRHQKTVAKYEEEITPLLKSGYTVQSTLRDYFSEASIQDDQLRMMFVCCHPSINAESQSALILKTLCGFSITEIAKAFLTNEETISKRIYRAKEKFRENKIPFELPAQFQITERLENVLKTLYLLFNEGYNATETEELIRYDLVEEAIRLCNLLASHGSGNQPETWALLALMCFHAARMPARMDADGNILQLQDQDRNVWNRNLINAGIQFLNHASEVDVVTTYHLEAAIAAEYCLAPSHTEIRWNNILQYYNALFRITQSPVIALNRAVVIAEIDGPDAGIAEVNKITESGALKDYYLVPSVLAEFYIRKNAYEKAIAYLQQSIQLTRSEKEKKFLAEKINKCMILNQETGIRNQDISG